AEQLAKVAKEKAETPGVDTLWVHISNLEAQLVAQASRIEVFRLLEKLLDRREAGRRVALVVTTTIDPLAHFNEIFLDERKAIYANVIPEVELNRLSLILTRMR